MTITARITTRVVLEDSANPNDSDREDRVTEIECDARVPVEDPVAFSTGFNALTAPSGARWVTIEPLTGDVVWTLKGEDGDTGIVLCDGSLPAGIISMPVFEPAIGITVSGDATARVRWF